MAPISTADLYPVPFPEGLREIHLKRISLARLLDEDIEEAKILLDVCTHEGFFYLDLTTHPLGLQMIDESNKLHNICADIFNNVPIQEKQKFKTVDTSGQHLDTGYKVSHLDEDGEPDRAEFVNISQNGLFHDDVDYPLPAWLKPHQDLYMSIMKNGNYVAGKVLACLEQALEIEPGGLTNLHKLMDSSGDFLRLFRYPAPKNGKVLAAPPTPPHTDAVSVAILFNWQGGLQITNAYDSSKTTAVDHEKEPEESWEHVRPVPGHAIVNLGDAMVVFTNGVTKSGKHRVITPPGPQGKFHRYSVLLTTRPKETAMMSSFSSPKIPATNEQLEGEVVNAHEWAWRKVRGILDRMEKK